MLGWFGAVRERRENSRIASIFADRSKRIADDLAAAQRFKEQSEAAGTAYQKALAEARNRAQTIAAETRERQAAQAETANKRLEEQLNEKLAAAAVHKIASGHTVFAGQRLEGFYVDLGAVFDLADLDSVRRATLFGEILSLGAQAWMTGTDIEMFAPLRGRADIFEVADSLPRLI